MIRRAGMIVGVVAMVIAPLSARADTRALVELFTSQGCSSCLEAGAYMAELSGRSDVISLSFHVDYWDYLGWQDTFGRPEHSARQREYAAIHGSRGIYTPQMIVNGTTALAGNDREAVEEAMKIGSLTVPVSVTRQNGALSIKVDHKPLPGKRSTTIRLILFSSALDVAITRGENAGSTVRYHNVVRAMRPIGMWDGAGVEITLPEHEIFRDGVDGAAVIVQEDLPGGPGAILGADALTSLGP